MSGCETPPPKPKGLDTTKKLEIDERLLAHPRSFPPRQTPIQTEFDILVEYADLAKAYSACYNNQLALVLLLEGSKLVVKVPSTATFMADPLNQPENSK
jgi:hypothetical protein